MCKATIDCSCETCNRIRGAIRAANEAKAKKPCSLCKARPGQSCTKPSGIRRAPHAERYAA
jgi:hypothetical protein